MPGRIAAAISCFLLLATSSQSLQAQDNKLKVLIIGGGLYHAFAENSKLLVEHLKATGRAEAYYTEDLSAISSQNLKGYDVLVLYLLHYTGNKVTLNAGQRAGLLEFVGSGKGLVALHCTIAAFDDWPQFGQLIGGCWSWGKSQHEPYRAGVEVKVADKWHEICRGLDDFQIHDELYYAFTVYPEAKVILTADHDREAQPMAWVKGHGAGRVFYTALGHGRESFENPYFRELVWRGILWVAKRD